MRTRLSAKAMLLALPLCMMLTSCTTLMSGQGIDPHAAAIEVACDGFRPITSSVNDTQQTRDEIIAHNAFGKKVCGWKK